MEWIERFCIKLDNYCQNAKKIVHADLHVSGVSYWLAHGIAKVKLNCFANHLIAIGFQHSAIGRTMQASFPPAK
jgi:hypothetical protein